MNAKPISESANPGCFSIGFVALFGSVFLFAGLAVIVTQVVMPWFSAKAAADWSQVPCKILSSDIEVRHGETTSHFVDIEYEYSVANQMHRGTNYDFSTMSRRRKVCREIIARYPVGKKSTCYVDPDDPDSAVLDRTPVFAWSLLFLGGIFSVVGASVAIGIPFAMTRKKKAMRAVGVSGLESDGSVNRSLAGQTHLPHLYPDDLEDKKWDEPQRLKPASTKIGSLLFMVGIAVFWNGIVWLLASGMLVDGFSLFLTLFLIPFVLIGLLIILGVVKGFLILFNPVVEIALSTGAIARGAEVDVAWEVKGNTGRIHRLQIAAVGTETARYRQGTDTRTETSDFGIIPIVDSADERGISFGSVAIKIPSNTMHTFSDDNNQITWAIEVKGEIRRWPDVLQTHVFRVKP